MVMGQARIFYAMSRDGLIPPTFSRVHPKYRTPYVGTVFVGVVASVLGGLLPISVLGDLVAMGTLLAFATVCAGVLVLRYTRPDLPRSFRVPAPIIICPLGAIACLYLFSLALADNWHWMSAWLLLGFLIYCVYGYRHSKLRKAPG
jgi:APA family basic amino acid/polyamine antiporter